MGHFYLMAFVDGTIGERWREAAQEVQGAARVVAPAELGFVYRRPLLPIVRLRSLRELGRDSVRGP